MTPVRRTLSSAPVFLLNALLLAGCASSGSFLDDRARPVATQRQVLLRKVPILLVVHDNEDDWMFLATGAMSLDPVVEIPVASILEVDSTVNVLADLPRGWKAQRGGTDSSWHRSRIDFWKH